MTATWQITITFFRGEHNPYLEFRAVYGNPFDKINDAPYDYFTATATLGLSPNQPLISKINLLGKLWGVPLKTSTGMEMMFGVFQHFNYFDSEEIINGSGRIPYKISEAASVGPGIIYKFPRMNSLVNLEQSVFLSAILLGGSLTDYYNVIDRNYNMGSGYSVKTKPFLTSDATDSLHSTCISTKSSPGKDTSTKTSKIPILSI